MLWSALDRVIHSAYQAALEPEGWAGFVRAYAAVLRADCASLMHVDDRLTGSAVEHDLGIEPDWLASYDAHFLAVDVRIEQGRRLAGRHPVLTDQILLGYCDYHRTEIYADYCRPQNRHHFVGFTSNRSADGWTTVLAAQRGRRTGPFDDDEVRFHEVLRPHLERALQLQNRLEGQRARGWELEAALDAVRWGVVLVDGIGRVVHANAGAERLLARGDGLAVTRDGVLAPADGRPEALHGLLRSAAHGGPGGTVAVRRRRGRGDLRLMVAPLPPMAAPVRGGAARMAVFVGDPDRPQAVRPQQLAALFGFTPAEARTAAALLTGHRIQDIAATFGVAEDTVRKAIKSLFQKTGTGRQAELVAHLLCATPTVDDRRGPFERAAGERGTGERGTGERGAGEPGAGDRGAGERGAGSAGAGDDAPD